MFLDLSVVQLTWNGNVSPSYMKPLSWGWGVINTPDSHQIKGRWKVMEEFVEGLKQVKDWIRVNKLRLSPYKTEVLAAGRHSRL